MTSENFDRLLRLFLAQKPFRPFSLELVGHEPEARSVMMKRHQFQEAVDAFKQRVPFRPFVVEMEDGRRIVVKDPKEFPCFAGGTTWQWPDGELMFVDAEDVQQVVELTNTPSA